MSIWETIAAPIIAVVNKRVPDVAQQAQIAGELAQAAQQGELQLALAQLQSVTSAQSDVDKIEAASTSVFIAGWRPFVGWVCGVGLAMSCIVSPLFTWFSMLIGHPTPFPKLDDVLLQSTLAGMLGLGYGLRTFEKFKGVAGQH